MARGWLTPTVCLVAGCNALFGVTDLSYTDGTTAVGGVGGDGAAAGQGGVGGVADGGGGSAPAPWWSPQFSHRVRIGLDNADREETLTDFTVAVELRPPNVDPSLLRPDGADLRFLDDDHETLLAHEAEVWDDSGGGVVWVKVPAIDGDSADDHIWLYFGSPDAVAVPADGSWSTEYLTVHHFATSTSGESPDSTGACDAQLAGAATLVPGLVGPAVSLDGTAGYVELCGSTDLAAPPGEARTVTLWVRTKPTAPGQFLWLRELDCRGWGLWILPDGTVSGTLRGGINCNDYSGVSVDTPSPAVQSDQWHHIAFVVDRVTDVVRLFVDGQLAGEAANTVTGPADHGSALVGASFDLSHKLAGEVDEFRIAAAARSADWVDAEHANLTGALVQLGAVEQRLP